MGEILTTPVRRADPVDNLKGFVEGCPGAGGQYAGAIPSTLGVAHPWQANLSDRWIDLGKKWSQGGY